MTVITPLLLAVLLLLTCPVHPRPAPPRPAHRLPTQLHPPPLPLQPDQGGPDSLRQLADQLLRQAASLQQKSRSPAL
jgi:hypothetical protein